MGISARSTPNPYANSLEITARPDLRALRSVRNIKMKRMDSLFLPGRLEGTVRETNRKYGRALKRVTEEWNLLVSNLARCC